MPVLINRRMRTSSGKNTGTHVRASGPVPLSHDASMRSSEASWSEDDEDIIMVTHGLNASQCALKATNDCIQHKIAKLQVNTVRLKRELWLLQRHVKNFNHPLYETWEADILTRLIEVGHAHQHRPKLQAGVVIGDTTVADRENLFHAYNTAAKQVREDTLQQLGLDKKYFEALARYNEVREIHLLDWCQVCFLCSHSQVALYRSPNPFQTENAFAKWLLDEKEQRPAKFDFWSKLFPVCYGRTVEESATMF
ncbi:hypothetical protein N7476_010085 [Penicillium atrosanguineum]|uniref:Uncharacterized protein n=1 Tax=Penicillium atrosanguineum TaxID=1132637 RepID=A0A9W9U0I3_9EURO|nr:hypothetical protein N7476_010085 [Penicillium atrosanguineum]